MREHWAGLRCACMYEDTKGTLVYQYQLPLLKTNYHYRCDIRDHPTDLGLCYSDVTFQLPQKASFNVSLRSFCWSLSVLLLAVMSILASAECARDHMLPSRSRLENGLGRWVQQCNSNERMITHGDVTQTKACLHSWNSILSASSSYWIKRPTGLCWPLRRMVGVRGGCSCHMRRLSLYGEMRLCSAVDVASFPASRGTVNKQRLLSLQTCDGRPVSAIPIPNRYHWYRPDTNTEYWYRSKPSE